MLKSILPVLLVLTPLVASHDAAAPAFHRRHVGPVERFEKKLLMRRQNPNNATNVIAAVSNTGASSLPGVANPTTAATTNPAGANNGAVTTSSSSVSPAGTIPPVTTTTTTSDGGLLGSLTNVLGGGTTTTPVAGTSSTTPLAGAVTSSSSSSSVSSSTTSAPTTSSTKSGKSSSSSTDKPSSTKSSSSSSSSSSSTSGADNNKSSKSSGLSKSTLIPIIVVASSVALIAAIWTIIRKTKFSPSRRFEAKLEPIDFIPTMRDSFDDPGFPGQHGRSQSAMSGSISKDSLGLGRSGTIGGPSSVHGNSGSVYTGGLARSDSGGARTMMSEAIPGGIPYNNPGTYGQQPYRGPTPGPGYNNEQAYGYSDLQRGPSTRNNFGGGMYDYGAQARAQQQQFGRY